MFNRRSKWAFTSAVVLACSIASAPGTVAAGRPLARGHRTVNTRHVLRHNPFGRFLGVLPTTHGVHRTTPAPNGTPPLVYHNGPVQHSSTAYVIFWSPSGKNLPIGYRETVMQYFRDVASDSYRAGNAYAADTQYYDLTGSGGSKRWISYDVTYGGPSTVHDAPPPSGCTNSKLGDLTPTSACLTDAQLQSEITSVVADRDWPRGLETEFFLFTPPG